MSRRRTRSKSLLYAIAVSLLLPACSSTGPGPAFCGLERGMTEHRFLSERPAVCGLRSYDLDWPVGGGWVPTQPGAPDPQTAVGNTWAPSPRPARSVRVGNHVWDIWTYNVYSRTAVGGVRRDHGEYAIFKDNQLVAWGRNTPSETLLRHPETTVEFAARR